MSGNDRFIGCLAEINVEFVELREKHDVDDAISLVDGEVPLQRACCKYDLDFRFDPAAERYPGSKKGVGNH